MKPKPPRVWPCFTAGLAIEAALDDGAGQVGVSAKEPDHRGKAGGALKSPAAKTLKPISPRIRPATARARRSSTTQFPGRNVEGLRGALGLWGWEMLGSIS